MRPSHVLHTFQVAKLRLVLDVQVSSGKQHTSGHAKAALGRLLDELGERRPVLVRGDSGYGNEGILQALEERSQPYQLRLRQTKNVQRLVARQFARSDWRRLDSQGCQMVEDRLQLHGWSKKRRVVIVRQRIRGGIARASDASTASNCGRTWLGPACTRATGSGSTRCWSLTSIARWSPSARCTAIGPTPRMLSTR